MGGRKALPYTFSFDLRRFSIPSPSARLAAPAPASLRRPSHVNELRREAAAPLRVFSESPAAFFEQGFRQIAETRMKGLPIVNPKIQVRAAAFRRWQMDWFGVMALPWCIAAVYACGCRESWPQVAAGREWTLELPAGDFPFMAIEDPILGRFFMLSLKSPVLDIENQAAADVFAQAAFDAMLTAQALPDDDEDAVAWIPPSADGELRRVIPIKVAPPKNYESTPALTPKKPEPAPAAEREPFFERRVSRRALFGRGLDKEKAAADIKKPAAPSTPAPSAQPAASAPADSAAAPHSSKSSR